MTKEQAYHAFLSSFDWKAYDENTVPDDAAFPRITYNFSFAEFDNDVALSLSLWDRTTSWTSVTNKANEIYADIGMGGKIIRFDGGAIWVKRGVPFAQRMSDENDSIRRIYVNITAEYLTTT